MEWEAVKVEAMEEATAVEAMAVAVMVAALVAAKAAVVRAVEVMVVAMAAGAMVEVETVAAKGVEVMVEAVTEVATAVVATAAAMAGCPMHRPHSNACRDARTPLRTRRCDRCCQAPPHADCQEPRAHTHPRSRSTGRPSRIQYSQQPSAQYACTGAHRTADIGQTLPAR